MQVHPSDPDIAVTGMWLVVGGLSLSLTHVCREFVMLEDPIQPPAAPLSATVILWVNGEQQEFPVTIAASPLPLTKQLALTGAPSLTEATNPGLVAA